MTNFLALMVIIFLTFSCQSRQEKISKLAAEKKFVSKIFHGKNFDIFTLQKIENQSGELKIYIEGDGFAYVDESTPALDPTPRSNFLINLLLQDKAKNILYVARVCQFVKNQKCEEKYWTSERFSKEAVAAIQEVVSGFSNFEHHLIGYSGGAAIINHLDHRKTKKITTIAGNLDLQAFTALHKISELEEEKINYQKLSEISQLHLVGEFDDVVPAQVFEAYKNKLPNQNKVQMKVIKNATHEKGWGVGDLI